MKKNKNINWPVGTFTIAELIEQNDHIIPITLRVRLKKMIDKGTVSELGTLPSEMGRPKMLLTKDELTNDVLKEAKLKDVCFKDKYQNMIDELSVTVKSSHEVDDSDEIETEVETSSVVLEKNLD
jgi:nucleoside 2-deoxyribosyltransferase